MEKPDPHFLPDLSAAVIILPPDTPGTDSDKAPGGKQ
jgi:hypothetical protein